MQQCRDCSSLVNETQSILCPRCRALAGDKRKAGKRDRARTQYSLSRRPSPPGKPRPPHPCLTKGCQSIVEGKSLYCPACHHARHLVQQRKYRDHVKARIEDLPPEPITNLDWLKGFSDWAKSGLSYAAYQKAGWEKREMK